MALSAKVELRQSTALVMTPQLQQAIKLLQLSNVDLLAYLEEELERNPLLERADDEGGPEGEASGAGDAEAMPERSEATFDSAELSARDSLPTAEDAPLDLDYEHAFTSDEAGEAAGLGAESWASLRGGSGGFDEERPFDHGAVKPESLRDHLMAQLALDVVDPGDRLIGAALIDLVDETGHLAGDIAAIAERFGCDPGRVESVLGRIQQFEPTGVAARSLSECLALQLRERDRLDPMMTTFIANLELVARQDIPGLMKVCRADAEDVRDMLAEVRSLNPKPGLAFGGEPLQPVIPDVFVRPRPDGEWAVELNGDTLPRLLVNRSYQVRVRSTGSSEDRSYLAQSLNAANWLVKSLDQRARTILRVASEIVAQQDSFLRYGVEFLRPLNLRDIAQVIEMHESTVSRVTANKYMATPRGIFPLKYFFTSALASASGGEAHSAESVRHRIRDLVEKETPDDVLSDDQIVDLLLRQGIEIARRTVAKYREAMRIPSSVVRRRQLRQMSA